MITKLHFAGEYFAHYLKKYFIFLLAGIAIGIITYFQRANILKLYFSLNGRHSYIGVVGQYSKDNLPQDITSLMSYGLSATSPAIISLDLRDNNKTYHFLLNTDLQWHNGTHFSAYDLENTYDDIQFKAIDSRTLQVILPQPFAPMASLLGRPLFLHDSLVGLGPYQTEGITYQEGSIKQLTLTSASDTKVFRFYPNETDLVNAFKLGQVDSIEVSQLPPNIDRWTNLSVNQRIATDQYTALFLNTDRLNVKAIRQALAYATPKTKNKNERCLGPISPSSWAYNSQMKEYNYNPTRGRELLGKNNVGKLTLLVNDRRLLNTAEEIASYWKQVLNLDVSVSILNSSLEYTDYDAILAYSQVPSDPDQYSFWHSTQSKSNITKLNNSRIDKLLEEGRTTFDQNERRRIYFDFQRFLLEESAAIFLKFPTIYTISRLK